MAATTIKMCIIPPPILSMSPNIQKNTTIPPSQRKKLILITTFHFRFFTNSM